MGEKERGSTKTGQQQNAALDGGGKQPLLVTYQGRIFDVTEFAPKHPGGSKLIKAAAGAEIDEFLGGDKRMMGLRHAHSQAAYDILQRYSLDRQFKEDPLVDGREPILWRVGDLGLRYWTWIHQPYDGVIRLFNSNLLEQLTRTKWWMIPTFWMPVVVGFMLSGFQLLALDFGTTGATLLALALFVIGILCWTLVEYSLHRCIFHWHPNPNSRGQITFHFLLHGLHHKTPMDADRLVFPPAAAILIVAIFYAIYRSVLPYPIFCCFASGKLFGYILYDMTHYYLHHGRPAANSGWHFAKVYHHNHHFKDSEAGFGISTTLWDHVFGTLGAGPI